MIIIEAIVDTLDIISMILIAMFGARIRFNYFAAEIRRRDGLSRWRRSYFIYFSASERPGFHAQAAAFYKRQCLASPAAISYLIFGLFDGRDG